MCKISREVRLAKTVRQKNEKKESTGEAGKKLAVTQENKEQRDREKQKTKFKKKRQPRKFITVEALTPKN
jgi:hypothetical protein